MNSLKQYYRTLFKEAPILQDNPAMISKHTPQQIYQVLQNKPRGPQPSVYKSEDSSRLAIEQARLKIKSMTQNERFQISKEVAEDLLQNRDMEEDEPHLRLKKATIKQKFNNEHFKGRKRAKSEQQFYNRWYIPPDKKFIRKESQSNYKAELQKDINYLYKNIGKISVWKKTDPFKPEQKKAKQTNEQKLLLNGALNRYKNDILNKGGRMPIFLRMYLNQ